MLPMSLKSVSTAATQMPEPLAKSMLLRFSHSMLGLGVD